MIAMDPRYIDVVSLPDGTMARGCRPDGAVVGSRFPVYEDAMPLHPRSDWVDLIKDNVSLERLIQWVHNQNPEGTCASNAACAVWETASQITVGPLATMMMSPISIYRWIASGPNTGSVIGDNLTQLQKTGCLPVDTPENRAKLTKMGLNPNHVLKHTGYYQKFPEGWEDTAAYFQGVEAYEIRSFDGIISALIDDFPVVYGRSGHAITGVTPVFKNGVWYVKYANSWGQWGEVGENKIQMFGYDSERFLSSQVPSYKAWALRTIKLSDKLLSLALSA
jgi:hypothetical protein